MRLAACSVSCPALTVIPMLQYLLALLAIGHILNPRTVLADSAVENARATWLAADSTVRGVNLGGWLVTERWCVSLLYPLAVGRRVESQKAIENGINRFWEQCRGLMA